jgi:hypothetical protein
MSRQAIPVLLLQLACVAACADGASGPSVDGPITFSALVDGRVWSQADTALISAYFGPRIGFTMVAWRTAAGVKSEAVSVRASSAFGLGAYTLAGVQGNCDAGFLGPIQSGTVTPVYCTASAHTGRLQITGVDTILQVIAGTFSFRAVRADSTVITVVGGQFRVPYTVFQ